MKVVLAAPIFGVPPNAMHWWPNGQNQLYTRFRNCHGSLATVKARHRIYTRSVVEYLSVAFVLKDWGVDFCVLQCDHQHIEDKVTEALECVLSEGRGIRVPLLDGKRRYSLYPRDLAVTLPGNTLLVNPQAELQDLPDRLGDWRVVTSHFGEGGRSLIRKHVAVIPSVLSTNTGDHNAAEDAEVFSQAGLTPIWVGNNICHSNEEDGLKQAWVDPHLDRCMGLLEDKRGDLHLIVDRNYAPACWSLSKGHAVRCEVSSVLSEIEKQCRGAGVTLHVLEKPLRVPLSVGFYQLPTGQVVLTAREGQLSELLNRLLGRKCVYHIPRRFIYHPVIHQAGIHCLLTEFPTEFLAYLQGVETPS